MKGGVRYIAIASGPIAGRKRTAIVGVIFRKNYMEGLLSSSVAVDGTDATARIARMIRGSRFRDQVRLLLFNGIALAGLNIVEPDVLEKRLRARVVILNRKRQNPRELIRALKEFSRLTRNDVSKRIGIVEDYGSNAPVSVDGLFMQSGLERHYLRMFAANAFEALRIAHIISSGISSGESKGRI